MAGRTKWRAREGTPYSDKDARIVGPALVRLEWALGEPVQTSHVVDAARDPKSVLHPYFQWDVQKAAERDWKRTARMLLTSFVTVEVQSTPGVQRFVNVSLQKGGRGYYSRRTILKSDDARSQLSRQLYQTISSAVEKAVSFNLTKDPAWRAIQAAVRDNPPLDMNRREAS